MYTRCLTAVAFDIIVNRLKPKHWQIQYFKENKMKPTKRYQFTPSKPLCQEKHGPKQELRLDDEVLLVLMCIHLDPPIEDIAFRFEISVGYALKVFATITIFFSHRIKAVDKLANT